MQEVLLFGTVLAPIILALVQLVKTTIKVNSNLIPIVALVIGLLVGLAAQPFTDLSLYLRLWSGALAGLSATGLFELTISKRGDEK